MKKMVSKKGFTLIELLIVITIIGILAAALLPSILGAPARARDAGRKGDLNSIIAALETYNNDEQSYPTVPICFEEAHGDYLADMGAYFQGGVAPQDPQVDVMDGVTVGDIADCAGYFYCPLDGNPTNYIVGAYMEVMNDGNAVDTDSNFTNACVAGDIGIDLGEGGSTFTKPTDADVAIFVVAK